MDLMQSFDAILLTLIVDSVESGKTAVLRRLGLFQPLRNLRARSETFPTCTHLCLATGPVSLSSGTCTVELLMHTGRAYTTFHRRSTAATSISPSLTQTSASRSTRNISTAPRKVLVLPQSKEPNGEETENGRVVHRVTLIGR
jgi:hypothetical protein